MKNHFITWRYRWPPKHRNEILKPHRTQDINLNMKNIGYITANHEGYKMVILYWERRNEFVERQLHAKFYRKRQRMEKQTQESDSWRTKISFITGKSWMRRRWWFGCEARKRFPVILLELNLLYPVTGIAGGISRSPCADGELRVGLEDLPLQKRRSQALFSYFLAIR